MKNSTLSLIAARSFLQYLKDRRIYALLSRTFSWGAPDLVVSGLHESTYNKVNDFNETVFAKQLTEGNFSLVVRRVDWVAGKVFNQWFDKDVDLKNKDFYCVTSLNHVYKCISNNGGAESTVEPSVVGTTRFETADGYVWKYMYSITSNDALKFMTPDLIPVKEIYTSETGYENQYASQVAAIEGTVDRIDVIQNGVKYSSATTIEIIGDGTGATATLVIHPYTGAVTDVQLTSNGSGYTWAQATISDPQAVPGTGAAVDVVLSPVFGHGYNPAEELFASSVVAKCTIEGDEGGYIKGDISYRKILLVADPKESNDSFATSFRYDNTVATTLTSISGTFVVGEKVEFDGGFGYVVFINGSIIHLSGVDGIPSGSIIGNTSSASGTVSSVTMEKLKFGGQIVFQSYFDPRTKLIGDSIDAKPIFKF